LTKASKLNLFELDEAEMRFVLQISKNNARSITTEQYNKEIDEAIARVEAGRFYTHDEVAQMAKHW